MRTTTRRIGTAALLTIACIGGAAAISTAAHAAPTVEGKYWSAPVVDGRYWSAAPVTDGRYWSGRYWSAAPLASASSRFAMVAVVV